MGKDRASSTTARPATTPSALARNVATACVLAGTLRSTQAVLSAVFWPIVEPRQSGPRANGARALRGHVANIDRVLLQRSQHALHPHYYQREQKRSEGKGACGAEQAAHPSKLKSGVRWRGDGRVCREPSTLPVPRQQFLPCWHTWLSLMPVQDIRTGTRITISVNKFGLERTTERARCPWPPLFY